MKHMITLIAFIVFGLLMGWKKGRVDNVPKKIYNHK